MFDENYYKDKKVKIEQKLQREKDNLINWLFQIINSYQTNLQTFQQDFQEVLKEEEESKKKSSEEKTKVNKKEELKKS